MYSKSPKPPELASGQATPVLGVVVTVTNCASPEVTAWPYGIDPHRISAAGRMAMTDWVRNTYAPIVIPRNPIFPLRTLGAIDANPVRSSPIAVWIVVPCNTAIGVSAAPSALRSVLKREVRPDRGREDSRYFVLGHLHCPSASCDLVLRL